MDVLAPAVLAPPEAVSTLPRSGLIGSLDQPRLSVVVVNYRHWDDTGRLIRHLRASHSLVEGLAEVVVVDNHSPAHPLIPRLRRARDVSLRRWRHNRGFARAVNEGCRLSRGEWLLLLNPDTTVPAGFLDHVLQRADDLVVHEPRAGIVGFRLGNDDGSWQLSTGRFPTLLGTLVGRLWPRHLRKYTPPAEPGRVRVDWVTGCCLLVRRECWRELGGLDPDFFLYYEDVDLCRRAARQGWSVWYDPATTVLHHRPLHTRTVPPHLHLITRHALLTYAGKHWPAWQAGLMAWIVRLETWLAGWRTGRDGAARAILAELDRIAGDLLRDRAAQARARMLRVVRRQEDHCGEPTVDRHSLAPAGRPAGTVPGEPPQACPGRHRGAGGQ
jgi:GT2 family glycosyltransferase